MSPLTNNLEVKTFNTEGEQPNLSVTVQFLGKKITTDEDLSKELDNISNPQVITWFLGNKGLNKKWFESVCDIAKKVRTIGTLYLYDLRNFENLSTTDDKKAVSSSKILDRIKKLDCPNIVCLDSAKFFQFLSQCNNRDIIEYVKKVIWQRKFIWFISKNRANSGITIEQSLGKSPILDEISDKDTEKTYSALQYLEGCFLVREMMQKSGKKGGSINLVFLLPNNELAYYRSKKCFQNDVIEMLKKQECLPMGGDVSITFISFEWKEGGKKVNPYRSDEVPLEDLELLKMLKG